MPKPWTCALCEATSKGTAVKRAKHDLSICSWCETELTRKGQLRCRRCNCVADRAEFKPSNPRYCRACRREMNAPHLEKNRQRNASRRATDPSVRERERDRARVWREVNHERAADWRRAHYRETRAERLAWQHAYYRRNRDRILARLRQNPQRQNPERRRIYRVRRKLAILRGLR